jgi:hypothetical protein
VTETAQAGLDARVSGFVAERLRGATVSPLSGDASTRRYFRVARGGETWVVALHPEPFERATFGFAVVRDLLAGMGLPVPAIVDDDGARGVLLLEDLGDLTLQESLRSASEPERDQLYRQALDQLARLQRESARGARTAECFQVAFDIEKLSWELHYFEKHFLEGYRGCELTVEDRTGLAEGFHRLAEEIASWPRVLCHRDFHSRNLMLQRGTLYWIDFQDARMGHASYDLVSLLRDSYVDLPEDLVAECADAFRRHALPGEDPATFERRFELMSVQRNLKALGTFGYMTTVRGTSVYLPYIPGTLRSTRRNLGRHPELAGLHRVLARHVEELK